MALSRAAAAPTHTPILRRAASGVTALALAASAIGVAAGLQLASAAAGTIEGVVFVDVDGDGVRGSDESGVEGVRVTAYDAAGNPAITAATGPDGGYVLDVEVDVPYRVDFAGWPDDLGESSLGPDNGSALQFVVPDAAPVSLGLRPDGSLIGGRVWLDLDADGIQAADEPGIVDATVEVFDVDGGVVAAETTDGAGRWQSPFPPESSSVRVDGSTATGLPFGIEAVDLRPTTAPAVLEPGADPPGHTIHVGLVADPVPPALRVELQVTSDDGHGDPTSDLAWYTAGTPVQLTVTVANDGPGDITGLEPTEVPAPTCAREPLDLMVGESASWTCEVLPDEGATSLTASTGLEGTWMPPFGPAAGFPASVAGRADAAVRIVDPAVGIAVTNDATGPLTPGDEVTYRYAVTNRGDVDLDLGSPTRLVDDRCAEPMDDGFHETAGAPFNVGDIDADGILDVEADAVEGDDALSGETWWFVCTTIVDPEHRDVDVLGAPLATLTNTATVLVTPVASDGSTTGLGNVSKQDSSILDLDDGTAVAPEPAPDPPPTPTDVVEPARLGGHVWHDLDADGVREDGEPGLGEVVVELLDDAGVVVGATVTDDAGDYGFDAVEPGVHRVRVEPPAGFRRSPGDQGVDDRLDSDLGPDGTTPFTTLDAAETDTSWDAGFHRLGGIGDRVWLDVDGDGLQSDGEPGVDGVVIRLIDAVGTLAGTTQTDWTGAYGFRDLPPGPYRLEFDTPVGLRPTTVDALERDAPESDALDSDLDPATGRTASVLVVSGQTADGWDAGFVVPTVVLSAPEVNTATPVLAITGRSVYGLVGLAVLLMGFGGTVRILADRLQPQPSPTASRAAASRAVRAGRP